MAISASRLGDELGPEALALAQTQASQAGVSLAEWVARLIADRSRERHSYEPFGLRGPPRVGWFPASGSTAIATSLRPNFDVDIWHANTSWLHAPHRSEPLDVWTSSTMAGLEVADGQGRISAVLRLVSDFHSRIDFAAVLLSTAFVEASVRDFAPRPLHRVRRRAPTWFGEVVYRCLERSHEVRNALVHPWEPTPRAERLAVDAFVVLSELTPASTELIRLCQYNRPRAFSELSKHLEAVTEQFELSANLLAEVEAAAAKLPEPAAERLSSLQNGLLERAGGGLSLTEAAGVLSISRQAMHKRIKNGSALGMMLGSELVLPRAQFIDRDGKVGLIPNLYPILKLFNVAGEWSALQFLLDPDPNLSDTPLHVLREGNADAVLNAARAYLDMDEG